MFKKDKKKEVVMTFPMYDEEGNRIVLVGKQVKANNVVFRRGRKKTSVTSLKKSLLQARIRSILAKQHGKDAQSSLIKTVEDFMDATRKLSSRERKDQMSSLPPLRCQWGECTKTFGNSKTALAQFRDHLEAHARKQAQFVVEIFIHDIITFVPIFTFMCV